MVNTKHQKNTLEERVFISKLQNALQLHDNNEAKMKNVTALDSFMQCKNIYAVATEMCKSPSLFRVKEKQETPKMK